MVEWIVKFGHDGVVGMTPHEWMLHRESEQYGQIGSIQPCLTLKNIGFDVNTPHAHRFKTKRNAEFARAWFDKNYGQRFYEIVELKEE